MRNAEPAWLSALFGNHLSLFADNGAPLYAHLAEMAARELRQEGTLRAVLEHQVPEPDPGLLALRLFALVHRWVLAGELPELALHYRSTGGWARPEGAWPLFRDAVLQRSDELPAGVARPYRHNELAGVAAVACAIEAVARGTGKPIRLLEAGAGAGLLLSADRHRDARWLASMFDFGPPRWREFEVVERRGCDPHPIALGTQDGLMTLRSRIWADLTGHHRVLGEAIHATWPVLVAVEPADCAEWLERRLGESEAGVATVAIHSTVLRSEPPGSLARLEEAVVRHAARATAAAPLAFVRLYVTVPDLAAPPRPLVVARLQVWPGGAERLVATCDVNGGHTQWLG